MRRGRGGRMRRRRSSGGRGGEIERRGEGNDKQEQITYIEEIDKEMTDQM